MRKKNIDRRKVLKYTAGTVGAAAAGGIGALVLKKLFHNPESTENKNKTKDNTNDDIDRAIRAAVYDGPTGSNPIVWFRTKSKGKEFYEVIYKREAVDGEGEFAALNRKYQSKLCFAVLQSLNPKRRILREGDMLYDLQPISAVSNDVLNRDYTLRKAIGTKPNSSLLEDITDRVNQK